MDTNANPLSPKRSWAENHPLVAIGGLLVLCLAPFINKAIHMDDALFVWSAERIQTHPGDFFGSEVNWFGVTVPMGVANNNPPLTSYFLALVASLVGWREIALHGAFLLAAFAACAGIHTLARAWCGRPLLATVVAIISPVFLISSTTLMSDVVMLAFWVWAVVIWENGLQSRGMWRLLAAGALAGLAVLAKYSALAFLPVLLVLAVLRKRRVGWWLFGLAVPLGMLAAYEFVTAKLYGRGLFSVAADQAAARRFVFESGWQSKGIIGLAFAGGCLLPVLFFAPLVWPRKSALVGGLLIFGLSLSALCFFEKLGPINLKTGNHIRWSFIMQMAILTTGGVHLLLLAAADWWQRKDTVSATLALWLMSAFIFTVVLNWTVSARSLLPMVPAAAILLMRRLERGKDSPTANGRLLWPLVPSAAISVCLAIADFRLANSARSAAQQISAKYKTTGGQLWFQGHWGFQYYMQKLGAQPVDFDRTTLQPGDIMVVPSNSSNTTFPAPGDAAEVLETMEFVACPWLSTMQSAVGAGFYAADWGPLPFAFGRVPPERYDLLKFLRPVQCRTPKSGTTLSWRVKEAGEQTLAGASRAQYEAALKVNPDDAQAHAQLALLLDTQGNTRDAIRHYREALRVRPDYVTALNNLAWILAAHPKAELRDGAEAVRLAARAVELTGHRESVLLGTLAAAYAETGQFAKAVETAESARKLAAAAGQTEVAAMHDKFLELYRAGKAARDTAGR